MRNKISLILMIILVTLALSACGTAYAQETQTPTRTLNVTGTGKVLLTPDIAYISIGVHTEGEDAAEAVSSNTTQSQKVVKVLSDMNIAGKDIQTSNFSIYPQQEIDNNGQVTGTKYVVDNTVNVTIRDLSKIGDILDSVVSAGSNSISGVQFDVEDKASALSEARKAAVADAQAQADELTKAAGVRLGPIQSINVYGGVPVPVLEGKGGGAAQSAAEVPISPGQLTLTVQVNVIYEIN